MHCQPQITNDLRLDLITQLICHILSRNVVHVAISPLPQSPESFLISRSASSPFSLGGPCLELSVLVGSLLQFMPHICCIEGYCVDLVCRQKWGESLGEGESLGLHLCFSFLRTPSNCMMLRPKRQTNSPCDSSMNK